jgi:L-methionine (R)-S-oxide reductase
MTPMSNELSTWLQAFLARNGGVAGTVHVLREDVLHVAASANIPEPVLKATAVIPRGKGMAGLALERDAPVTTCNLKEDTSGAVKPGARAVNAQAAVALPVHGHGGGVRAVVGIAFPDERTFTQADLDALAGSASDLPEQDLPG